MITESTLLPAPVEEVVPEQGPEDLFLYEKAKVYIDEIIGSFSVDIEDCRIRRDERFVKVDIEELRRRGDIEEDETFIPDRVIDGNIMDENADNLAFLNAGFRLVIFDCISNPSLDCRKIEEEVTKGLTYTGWYKQFNKVSDGALAHGRDYLEVVFDESKPLHCGVEQCGFDRIFFNKEVEDIQDSEWLLREYSISIFRLEEFRDKFGFKADQIDILLNTYREKRRNKTIKIYKCYFKYNNCVYITWYAREGGFTDWIKNPEKLKLGVYDKTPPDEINPQGSFAPAEIDIYPIFPYIYREDEQAPVIDHVGRGFLDQPNQEANTCIITSFVNKALRSAAVYATPKQDDGESAEMKQLDMKLVPMGVYAKALEFFSIDAPDPLMLQSTQFLDAKNSQRRGKIAATVVNRKDSRKTAKELEVADQSENKIISVSVGTWSEFLRTVFEFEWRIIQSQALQDKIFLMLKEQTIQQPMGITKQVWSNDKEFLTNVFNVRPAGDTDVIEAAQKKQQMMQDWPVIQTTALAQQFLIDYIKISYPKQADEYIQILLAGDPGKKLVASLAALLQGALSPEEVKALPPDQMAQLQTVQQEVNAYLGNNQEPAKTVKQGVPA